MLLDEALKIIATDEQTIANWIDLLSGAWLPTRRGRLMVWRSLSPRGLQTRSGVDIGVRGCNGGGGPRLRLDA